MDAVSAAVDVAVIGGGPAGAAAAALLAEAGHRVVLAERTRFPRFHIGESLLPHSLPVLARIGALPAVEAIGVTKFGADFTDVDGASRDVRFTRALRPGPPNAFQVKRAAFDAVLLDAARDKGATVLEETAVRAVDLDWPDGVRLELQPAGGQHRWIEARQVIDASGRDGLIARKLGLRSPNRHHQSAAVFSHFEDVPRHDGERAGHVSIYWFDQGWIWFIPLPDDQMSVGAVCTTDYFKSRTEALDAFLDHTLARAPAAAARMRQARRIEPVRAASNYSYGAGAMSGPRHVLIGDAVAFIDPVFSSGVHLALHGAALAADLVHARLTAPDTAAAMQRRFERRLQRGIADMSWLIYRVRSPVMRHLFLNPRNILGVEQALVSILAGDIFGSAAIRWRFSLFKLIFWAHRLWFAWSGGPKGKDAQAPGLKPMASR
jgi:flavin-dependent dehydrogenase